MTTQMVSNMTPLSEFAGMPESAQITGKNFGNGPWVLTMRGHVIGEFCTLLEARHAAWYAEAIERCAQVALEQRCERNTHWHMACVAIAAAIRKLKDEP